MLNSSQALCVSKLLHALIIEDLEADLKHLFEPFRWDGNTGVISGTGLGLVITKESVELHSGTIVVVSQVGVVTLFAVNIPMIEEWDN